MASSRQESESIDKRNAAVMRLEQRYRDAVLALVAARHYLAGEYRQGFEQEPIEQRVAHAMREIEKCLAVERK